MSGEYWVRCRVRPGVFSGEFIVSIVVADHERHEIEFVADQRSVRRCGNGGEAGTGQVRVWLNDNPGRNPLRIIVPASGGSDSMAVSVPQEELAPA